MTDDIDVSENGKPDWRPSEEKRTKIMWVFEFMILFAVIELWVFNLIPLPMCIGLCLYTFLVTLALNGWKL